MADELLDRATSWLNRWDLFDSRQYEDRFIVEELVEAHTSHQDSWEASQAESKYWFTQAKALEAKLEAMIGAIHDKENDYRNIANSLEGFNPLRHTYRSIADDMVSIQKGQK